MSPFKTLWLRVGEWCLSIQDHSSFSIRNGYTKYLRVGRWYLLCERKYLNEKWIKHVAKGFNVERDKDGNIKLRAIPAIPKKKRGFKMLKVTLAQYLHISHLAGRRGVTPYLSSIYGQHELYIKMTDNITANFSPQLYVRTDTPLHYLT